MSTTTSRTVALDQLRAAERAHDRRLAVTTALAVLLTLPGLLSASAPEPETEAERARRWGFLGPERIVAEIEIPEHDGAPLSLSLESGEPSLRGAPASGAEGDPGPSPRAPRPAPGTEAGGSASLSARDLMRASLPTVRSEELVIDVLVKPEYPPEAQARGLQAIVEMEALVDVDGTVRETRLLSNSGDPMFAESAAQAVSRCRFRPYRQDGVATPVFAHFRFNFHLL